LITEIFVSQDEHKTPSADTSLAISGVFQGTGKVMSHSLVHTGNAGFGISKPVAHYLLTENINIRPDVKFNLNDICLPRSKGLQRFGIFSLNFYPEISNQSNTLSNYFFS